MHRIDGAGHVNHMFASEDLDTLRPPTEITEDWLNSVQEELSSVVEAAGDVPEKGVNSQVLTALKKMFDLSGETGAERVGYRLSKAGAKGRGQNDKNDDFVNLLDYMTPDERVEFQLGLGTTDVSDAFIAAIADLQADTADFQPNTDWRGGIIYCRPGRGRFTKKIPIPRPGIVIQGGGQNATIFFNETAAGDVFEYIGANNGVISPLGFRDFAIVQRPGIAHTDGAAIRIDGNGFGATVEISNVLTYGTKQGVRLRDTYLSDISRVHGYWHENAFLLDDLCTSLTFTGCYAGACSGSGYKIAGHYLNLIGCGSDSNALDAYEVYYNGGASTAINFSGCGGEVYGRDGISIDRAVGITICSPRLITGVAGAAGIKLAGGTGYSIIGPVISALAANANPAINISSSSGAYPNNVFIQGISDAVNYATLINNPEYVTWIPNRNYFGLSTSGMRLGDLSLYNKDLQGLFNSLAPVGSGGVAYGHNNLTQATTGFSAFAAEHFKPILKAPGQTVARLIASFFVETPTLTSGSMTRLEGGRINDQTGASTANANLALGDSAVPVGTWNICSVSTRENLFAGPIRWSSASGPIDTFGYGSPEGRDAASVGSTYRKLDGGPGTSHYFKESGTGNTGWVAK